MPIGFKEALVPGSLTFLLYASIPGLILLFRRRDHGRAGKIWLALLLLFYWVASTPAAALRLVDMATPAVPAIQSPADAKGAGAIVVLGGGMDVQRSRGDFDAVPTRETALRVLEAARLARLLSGVPVVVTGGPGWEGYSEADLMADRLIRLGVAAERILKEEQSRNTRDHAQLVPPILRRRGITAFVLVTSRQHMPRALGAFRAVGVEPVPSAPEVYVSRGRPMEMYLPSRGALSASQGVIYDLFARLYYRARGWVS